MEKIELGRVAVMVTERCNLRCRLCAPMTPYWINTHDIPLERLERAMGELFAVVKRVGKFSIGGGGRTITFQNPARIFGAAPAIPGQG